MGEDEIIDDRWRFVGDHAADVAEYPVGGGPAAIGRRVHTPGVSAIAVIAGVEEHRRAVRQDKKRRVPVPRADLMDVQCSWRPRRQRLAHTLRPCGGREENEQNKEGHHGWKFYHVGLMTPPWPRLNSATVAPTCARVRLSTQSRNVLFSAK